MDLAQGILDVLKYRMCPEDKLSGPWLWEGAGGMHLQQNALVEQLESVTPTAADTVLGILDGQWDESVCAVLSRTNEVGCFTGAVLLGQQEAPSFVRSRICIPPGRRLFAANVELWHTTALSMALKIMSTAAMIAKGLVFQGMMMCFNTCSNEKLWKRAIRILERLTGMDADACEALLIANDKHVKQAYDAWVNRRH